MLDLALSAIYISFWSITLIECERFKEIQSNAEFERLDHKSVKYRQFSQSISMHNNNDEGL